MILLQASPICELWHVEESNKGSNNSPELILHTQAFLFSEAGAKALQLLPQL